METADLLRADHALLRKKILLIESALQVGPEARLALREMSYSLMRLLEAHLQREIPCIQRSHQDLSPRGVMPVLDHSVERHLIRSVHRLLTGPMHASMPMIILRLSQGIEQLRVQMDRQERLLLPYVAETWGADESGFVPLDGAMSVNEVLHRYPRARDVFEALRISRLDEGCDSVDEVAWRHGMDAADILEQLRSAVAGTPSYWYGE